MWCDNLPDWSVGMLWGVPEESLADVCLFSGHTHHADPAAGLRSVHSG